MIIDDQTAANIGEFLLEINAVVLRPNDPFTWASGWKSPIYCDNRKTLSYPKVRTYIRDAFAAVIKQQFSDAEIVAGVATGGIAQGALVADTLELPFIYVRSKAKGHGLTNAIEGAFEAGQKVVVVEDLVSTGGSSLKAVEALREAGCDVVGMIAIFTYGFEEAERNMAAAGVQLVTLCDYSTLLPIAQSKGYVDGSTVESLQTWRQSPATWNPTVAS